MQLIWKFFLPKLKNMNWFKLCCFKETFCCSIDFLWSKTTLAQLFGFFHFPFRFGLKSLQTEGLKSIQIEPGVYAQITRRGQLLYLSQTMHFRISHRLCVVKSSTQLQNMDVTYALKCSLCPHVHWNASVSTGILRTIEPLTTRVGFGSFKIMTVVCSFVMINKRNPLPLNFDWNYELN